LLTLGWLIHAPVLRAVGEAPVVDEPVRNADVIVIAADALDEGVVEAATLVHNGTAPRVAVFRIGRGAALDGSTQRLAWRGPTARVIAALNRYEVPVVEQIPAPVTGTSDSIPALFAWCRERGFHTVVLITTSDHSRRVRRVLDRAFGDSREVRVSVHVARSSIFRPDDWWMHGAAIYKAMMEIPKLVVDVLIHPRS
jgi:hypothetical protein